MSRPADLDVFMHISDASYRNHSRLGRFELALAKHSDLDLMVQLWRLWRNALFTPRRKMQASRAWEWCGTSHRGHGQSINQQLFTGMVSETRLLVYYRPFAVRSRFVRCRLTGRLTV